jgi:hypothetical protein
VRAFFNDGSFHQRDQGYEHQGKGGRRPEAIEVGQLDGLLVAKIGISCQVIESARAGSPVGPRKVDINIYLNLIPLAIEFDDGPGIILTEFLADSGLWARPCPRKTRPGIVPEFCHRFGRDATSISPGGSLAPP